MNLSLRASARVPRAVARARHVLAGQRRPARAVTRRSARCRSLRSREDAALRVPVEQRVLAAATRRSSRSRAPARARAAARICFPFQFETPMYRALPARTTSVSASSVSSSGTSSVVAVALVEVDVVGAEPRERRVDLLQDLRAREPAVAVAASRRTPSSRARTSRADATGAPRRGTPPRAPSA